ncbi:glycosyltransferase [Streptomyces aquilus]|uniref:glycosyltransferase n=1 Tax=Streptomyces aquilus TaxID=2548456 RepID=UPI0036B0A7BD
MRVLLMSYGSRGDVEPLAGLTAALRELDVEVRACVPPDEELAALLTAAGAEVVSFGSSVRALVTGARGPSPDLAFKVAAELVAGHFGEVAKAAEGCDALLATGLMPAGARSVAEHLGIPYVLACFHPCGLPSSRYAPLTRPGKPNPPGVTDLKELWRLDAERVNALYGEALNTHRAALGMPPVDNVRDHVLTERPWLAADPALGPWQEMTDLELVPTGAWIRPDDRPLPAELEAFLAAGAPPVYVGFGSMAMHAASDVGPVAIEAVRAQGRRVLLGRGWADLSLVDGQDDCFAVGDVNHQLLFPRVAAVVHHGGAGTTTTAARAGAPQVIVPQVADQPLWAAQVAELGIGVAHDGPRPTLASLSAALETALSPETRERAEAVAGRMRTDGAMVAAKLLIEEIHRGGPSAAA